MAKPLSPREEARQFADAVYDRRITPAAWQRLDELITNDLGCLQAYIERIDFHGALLDHAIERHPGNPAVAAMNQIARNTARQERQKAWGMSFLLATCALLMVGAFSWLVFQFRQLPPGVGTVANLTIDLKADASTELGQVVRQGSLFSLSEGIASLQLPNVLMDIMGGSQVRMTSAREVELFQGSVHAAVEPGGEGFTVRTPDSRIVDLGTEFVVSYSPGKGTEISVRKGRVQASLLDRQGVPLKMLEITTERSATISQRENSIREMNFIPAPFLEIDKVRGTIQSIDGTLRTVHEPPPSLAQGQLPTPNQILVIPERQGVVLENDLEVTGIFGPVTIPAGTAVSSYLIHYEPDHRTNSAPRGAVTFHGRITAVLADSGQLARTDKEFGLPGTIYEKSGFRELELDEDEVRVSDDQKTASFYFGVSGGQSLDQARLLITSPHSSR